MDPTTSAALEDAVSHGVDENLIQDNGSPESVRAHIHKLSHEIRGVPPLVLENVAALIVPGIVAEATKQGNPKRVYRLAQDAMNVIRDLYFALNFRRSGNESGNRPWMWWHIKVLPRPRNSNDDKYNTVSKELLEAAAGQYLSRPWMQDDYIDWCIVDASVQMEFFAYTRSIWNLGLLFIIALFGASLWSSWQDGSPWVTQTSSLFAVVLAAGIVFFVIRPWMAMYDSYKSLDGAVLSPTSVRTEIQAAKKKGVVWPRVIWPIIDAAVARNPNVWSVSPLQR